MTPPAVMLSEMAIRLAASGMAVELFRQMSDDEVIETQRAIAALSRELGRCQALSAAEVAQRSRPSAGMQGLAQRQGHFNAESMLQSVTGASKREARSLTRVGSMISETTECIELERLRDADPEMGRVIPPVEAPWFAQLAAALERGELQVAAVDAIRTGMGEPNERVPAAALANALPALIDECRTLNADQARLAARAARDRLDFAGVAERHESQRHRQFWRLWVKDDGMVRGEFELEPENGMLMKGVFDQLAHPRRVADRRSQGRRRPFGAPPVHSDHVGGDLATRQRDAAEGLVQLVRAGASVDPERVLYEVRPAVRLVVNEHALGSGSVFGTIEGHRDAVPLHAVETGLCEGYLPIRFDDEGRCLDLGREERLFSRKQKTALAVRDGGCMDPDCDRPPSWTEAHHIRHWKRDQGRTDLADGILLCRRDHLRYHNQGWEIRRDGAVYWLIPPPTIDPDQTPRRMRSKTRADILNPVVLGDAASHGFELQHASR